MAAAPLLLALTAATLLVPDKSGGGGAAASTSLQDGNQSEDQTPDLVDEDDGVAHVARLVRRASKDYYAEKERDFAFKVASGEIDLDELERQREKRAQDVITAMQDGSLLD